MPIVSYKGLTPKQSALTEKELKHLLRRTTFGLSRELLAQYQNRTLNSVVDELLTHTPEFEQPLNYDPNLPNYAPQDKYGETWVNNLTDGTVSNFRRYSLWSNLNQKHLISSDITEKMTIFFHHFIPIGEVEIDSMYLYWNYKYLRDNCLGNFKTIIKKTCTDNAMLIYLNGFRNKVGAPDENFARELLELFTLGKEYSPIYSESDIKEAAKVLTGYYTGLYSPVYNYGTKYWFIPNRHDTTDKKFSSFFNNKVIKGQTGANGEKETDELINMIFEKEEVSIYFVTRLYRFFVYYEIDDTIKNNIILPLAKIMRDNNYEIKPVVDALLKSEHFYDTNVIGSHIKNPMDLIYGASKEFNFKYDYWGSLFARYANNYHSYRNHLFNLGFYIFNAPDVSGWKAYYQKPLYHENWITTDSILLRVKSLNSLFTNFGSDQKVNVINAAKSYSNISNINMFIDDVLDWHLTIEPTADIKAYMKSILLYGQVEDHYWEDLWNAHIANPSDTQIKNQLTNVLKEFFGFLVSLPEYQLM